MCKICLLSISGLTESAYITYLINQWLNVPCSCFNFLLLLQKYNFVTQQLQDYMYSIGKHIFWILNMGFSFVADYNKFIHLIILNYFTGSFTCVTRASNHEQGSLEQCLTFLLCKSSFILYLLITTRSYGVSKNTAQSGWR